MGSLEFVPHLGVQMEIVVWVHLVMMCLRGWTSGSIAMWLELTSYRLDKAFHCKAANGLKGRAFVIYEFTNNKKQKLEFRTDRSLGQRKDTVTTSSSSSVESFGTDLEESSPLVDFSPQSPASFVSTKGIVSKIPAWLSVMVNQYFAADTITRINGHPPHSNVLRTITFKGDRAKRPSLWDVMILASVVHNDSATYIVPGRQCYWFADTIFGLLEKWATIYNNEVTTTDETEKVRRGKRQGAIGLVPVHRRDPVHINKIWDDFTGERQIMGKQREEFERSRTEEIGSTGQAAQMDTEPLSGADATGFWEQLQMLMERIEEDVEGAEPDSEALPSLLSMLNDRKPGSSITSVVNATTVDLMCKLLSREDYISVASGLSQASDGQNLLDFMLHLLRHHQPPTINRRVRRFMFQVISQNPVIPPSLIITGVGLPAERECIGGGGFGCVFKGELRGTAVALKVLYKSDNSVTFCREALMWRSLKHKFVLPFLGIQEYENGKLFLVSPYMKNGTLAQWRKKKNPSIAEIQERIREVAQGFEYIHSEGVVHGDLRGENILLDDNLHIQIADFGLSRLSEATSTRSGALHLNFAAPELLGFSKDDNDPSDDIPTRSQMSDVYAFECLYYEIYYDSVPFAGRQDIQILALIGKHVLPLRLDEPPLSDDTWNLIQRCWTREASERPRMKDVTESMVTLCPLG